jgi:hypothetical protein
VLNIDPQFFYFIIQKCNSTYLKLNQFDAQQYSGAIRKFLLSHIRNEKYKIEHGIQDEPYFFEGLTSEEEKTKEGDESALQRANEEDLIVYDCPIEIDEKRSKEDVLSFLKICELFVRIKDGNPKIMAELFSTEAVYGKLISYIFKAIVNKNVEAYISLLLGLSNMVHIQLGLSKKVRKIRTKNITKIFDEIEMDRIMNRLSKKEKSQAIFLQFILLFSGTKLNTLIKITKKDTYKVKKKLNYLYSTINKFLPESQKLLATAIKPEDAISSLFESGFFGTVSKYFFHEILPYTQDINNPENIFGIIMGLSLQDKDLIRNSLIGLIGKSIQSNF